MFKICIKVHCCLKTFTSAKSIAKVDPPHNYGGVHLDLLTFGKGDTPDRTPQVGFCGSCLIGAIGMSLSDKSMIFGSGKS